MSIKLTVFGLVFKLAQLEIPIYLSKIIHHNNCFVNRNTMSKTSI